MNNFFTKIAISLLSKISKDLLRKALENTKEHKFKLDLSFGSVFKTYFLNSDSDEEAIEWAKRIIHNSNEQPSFYSLYECIDSRRKIYRELIFNI